MTLSTPFANHVKGSEDYDHIMNKATADLGSNTRVLLNQARYDDEDERQFLDGLVEIAEAEPAEPSDRAVMNYEAPTVGFHVNLAENRGNTEDEITIENLYESTNLESLKRGK